MLLYGFLTQEEYDLFQLLITVSGIGPKVAMGIIGAITPAALSQAVQNKNIKTLTALPGIGKKSAERLILELKDKLHFGGEGEMPETEASLAGPAIGDDVFSEASAALLSLGYSQGEVSAVFQTLGHIDQAADVQTVIRMALKELSRR